MPSTGSHLERWGRGGRNISDQRNKSRQVKQEKKIFLIELNTKTMASHNVKKNSTEINVFPSMELGIEEMERLKRLRKYL